MSALRWWLRLTRPYAGWFALGILLSLVTVFANMALMVVAGWFITGMAAAGLAGTAFNYFTPAAVIRALAIARTGGRYLERLVTHDATLRLLTALRVWFYQQVEPLSGEALQQIRGGDLLARIRADIDTLDQVYLSLVIPSVVGLVSVATVVAVLWPFSMPLALLQLSLLVTAGVVLPAVAQALGRGPGAHAVESAAELREHAVDLVEGLDELTIFGDTRRRRLEASRLGRRWIEAQERLSRITGLSEALLVLLTGFAVVGSIWIIAPLIRGGVLPLTDFAPGVLLAVASFEGVGLMPGAWQALGGLMAATRRLRSFESARPAVREPREPAPPPQRDEIRFEQVGARYGNEGGLALDDVSFTVDPGERVVVVGASGAGKTTLFNLLLRLTDYERGEILWDGRPLRHYASEDLRGRLAAVPQRVYLFHTTIRENLLLGRPDASEDQMVAAARVAGIHDEILTLPGGYDTLVGEEGKRLSGGQARRVGIARALLRDAPVVLMDEPTEGLDAASSRRLWRRLDDHLRGRTLILISHRMAWARRADRILVFDGGRLVASGRHETLIQTSPEYRRLNAHVSDDALPNARDPAAAHRRGRP